MDKKKWDALFVLHLNTIIKMGSKEQIKSYLKFMLKPVGQYNNGAPWYNEELLYFPKSKLSLFLPLLEYKEQGIVDKTKEILEVKLGKSFDTIQALKNAVNKQSKHGK
jgi:hypothetical protein